MSPAEPETVIDQPQSDPCPHGKIVDLYHQGLPELPAVREWNDVSKKNLRARWRENEERRSLEWWRRYFELVRGYPYLMGSNDHGWTANLAWLISPKNMAKVLNGHYQTREPPRQAMEGKLSRAGQATLRNIQALRAREVQGNGR